MNESISQTLGRMCNGLNMLLLKGKGNYYVHLEVWDSSNQCSPRETSKMKKMFHVVLFNLVSVSHIQLLST